MMRSALLLTVLSFIAGCTSSKDVAVLHVPADFRVAIAEGGGFTGLWQGYSVRADGSVEEWSGPAGRTATTHLGTLSAGAVGQLWNAFRADTLLQGHEFEESGDLTRTLEITADQQTLHHRWIPRSTPDGQAAALQTYYHLVLQHVSALKKE